MLKKKGTNPLWDTTIKISDQIGLYRIYAKWFLGQLYYLSIGSRPRNLELNQKVHKQEVKQSSLRHCLEQMRTSEQPWFMSLFGWAGQDRNGVELLREFGQRFAPQISWSKPNRPKYQHFHVNFLTTFGTNITPVWLFHCMGLMFMHGETVNLYIQ